MVNDCPDRRSSSAAAVAEARPASRRGHLLGPLVYRRRPANPRAARWWAAVVLGGCLGLLGLAAFLKPNPRGVGTHAQLGLPECGLMRTTGLPCPTCGMTTAFAQTVRGRWLAAFNVQPAGWALCVGVMAAGGLALSVLCTGQAWQLNWYRVTPVRLAVIVVGLLLAGWAYKIVHALASASGPGIG